MVYAIVRIKSMFRGNELRLIILIILIAYVD